MVTIQYILWSTVKVPIHLLIPISTTIRERIRDDIIFSDKTFEKIVRFPFATNPFSYEKYPVASESRIAIVRESKTTFL